MIFPIRDMPREDGTDQRIALRPLIEVTHQPIDHRFVDAGAANDIGDQEIAAGLGVLVICAHLDRILVGA